MTETWGEEIVFRHAACDVYDTAQICQNAVHQPEIKGKSREELEEGISLITGRAMEVTFWVKGYDVLVKWAHHYKTQQ